jgi:hypothetical protein
VRVVYFAHGRTALRAGLRGRAAQAATAGRPCEACGFESFPPQTLMGKNSGAQHRKRDPRRVFPPNTSAPAGFPAVIGRPRGA